MDIVLLNEEFKNEEFVDVYSSFIWREAFYGGDGDFELTMSKTDSDASSMAIGRILTHSDTNRMCVIDTLEEGEDDEGVVMSTWKGIDFTRWVFSRRSVMRTKMPTYRWLGTPHNSSSVEVFNGAVTRTNDYVDPHFANAQNATPSKNPSTGSDVEGNLRVSDGSVSISNVTCTAGAYRSFYYSTGLQYFTPSRRSNEGWTFWIHASDINLTAGARIVAQVQMYSGSNVLSTSTSLPITEEGWHSLTTPSGTYTPNYYRVNYIIDNSAGTGRPAITDCSVTFSQPILLRYINQPQTSFFSGAMSYLMLNPERKFSGTPMDIMNKMINDITRNNTDRPNDNIATTAGFPPMLGGYSTTPKNPVPIENVDLYFGAVSLYDALLSVGETYDLGVSIMRNTSTGQLFAWSHGGTDRKSVITYDPETDTLNNPSSVQTARDYMSHAIVYGKNDYVITDAAGSTTSHEDFSGYDREMLVVQASDVDLPHGTEELYSVLVQRGREALNAHQRISDIDGEVPPHVSYEYGTQFGLGSMVTVKNDNGGVAHMRVTEYIFVSDEEGVRSYPTLSKDRYIDPGTWEASRPSELWSNAVGFWEDR